MGKKDTIEKVYLSDKARFADVVNYAIFGGKQVVLPEHLMEIDPVQSMAKTKDGNTVDPELSQKIRDLLCKASLYTTDFCDYILVGIENQTELHYAMPARNMLYDALSYDKQLCGIAKSHADNGDRLRKAEKISGFARTDTLKPVVTIVVYWNAGDWTAARSLHEMFPSDTPDEVRRLSADYKLNLVIPSEIENYKLFQTGVRAVLKAMEASGNKKDLRELLENDADYKKIDRESAIVISVLADMPLQIPEDKEVDMCTAVKEWKEELIEEGQLNGENKLGSLITAMLASKSDAETIARVSTDPEYRKTMYIKFNII